MKKSTFKKLFNIYDALVDADHSHLIEAEFKEEIKDMRDILFEVAEDGLDSEDKEFNSEKEIQEYLSKWTKFGIAYEEPKPAEHSGVIFWSQRDHKINDSDSMDCWPTWCDGRLVRIGEKAVSMRGPLEITGIELVDGGYHLWGYVDDGEVDDVTGMHLKRKYIIDSGSSEHSHPVREGEYCDFWPESEEDALEYYGKEVLYKNTGRAHLLEEDDGQEG